MNPSKSSQRAKKPVPHPIDADCVYTSQQLCQAAGISRWTLRRWKMDGLKPIRKPGGVFFLGRDVLRFFQQPSGS